MPVVKTRRCPEGHLHDVLMWPDGYTLSQDNPTGTDLRCPTCAAPPDAHEEVFTAGTAINTGGEHGVGKRYPYFDRAFGCEVRSAQHRAQLCKRHNVVPLEGAGASVVEEQARQLARAAQESKRIDEANARMMDGAEGREYRRMERRGWVEDQLAPVKAKARAARAKAKAEAEHRMEQRARRATTDQERRMYERLGRGR